MGLNTKLYVGFCIFFHLFYIEKKKNNSHLLMKNIFWLGVLNFAAKKPAKLLNLKTRHACQNNGFVWGGVGVTTIHNILEKQSNVNIHINNA